MTERMMWTVYKAPPDFPAGYLARKFKVDYFGAVPTDIVILGEKIELIRKVLTEYGLQRFDREAYDDAHVVENWL